MRNLQIKSIIGMIVTSAFFTIFFTESAFAQRTVHKNRNGKKVVVVNNNAPRPSARIVHVPRKAKTIRHNGVKYRFYNGTYYRPVTGGFVISTPPAGVRVNTLPPGYRSVIRNGAPYYVVGNVFYRPIRKSNRKTVYEVAYL